MVVCMVMAEGMAGIMDTQLRDICHFYRILAEVEGYELNPDTIHVTKILKGLLAREKKYGKRYCPCRVVTGDMAQDAGSVCPCIYHRDEIAKGGMCHCKLFVRVSEDDQEPSGGHLLEYNGPDKEVGP